MSGYTHNQTATGRPEPRQRVVVEHRIAWLVQLGYDRVDTWANQDSPAGADLSGANVSLMQGHGKRPAEQRGISDAEAAWGKSRPSGSFSCLDPNLQLTPNRLGHNASTAHTNRRITSR